MTMQVGDTVAHINNIGIVVGVSTLGNPIVESKWSDVKVFSDHAVEELIVVELPKPVEELNPENEKAEASQVKEENNDI